ncbi:MAG TPA: iron-siderophore ABC transporter substrate-binding protein [Candidatus Halomonas stercoripullorum]|uniref:Iron-siderophore ABC transporter substrate-binding protein n=1 Tax=Candidatus Halomonas stercoripullorum TaxID=2838617 RepID=A0A9D1WNF3_9GAMM|nr:iron-siderophore ABC transporter substrate-binding protein [Candidatus Halomonas stercoripullorum]
MPNLHFFRYLSTALLGGLLISLSSLALARDEAIATLDWTVAETLVVLGSPPQGVAQIDAYHAWVQAPALPESITDLGLRAQPNLERLAALAPDRILITPMFANLTPQLQRIAPVEMLELYRPEHETWQEILRLTRELGTLLKREEAAERMIENTELHLATLRQRLPANLAPILIVQFIDARHVRIFAGNSLYQAVVTQLGLDNAWQEKTNAWGFSLVALERLATIDARLVVVEPYPVGVEERLADSGLWQHQPSVRNESWVVLPPVWSFGALPSARRFAEQLVTALSEESP